MFPRDSGYQYSSCRQFIVEVIDTEKPVEASNIKLIKGAS